MMQEGKKAERYICLGKVSTICTFTANFVVQKRHHDAWKSPDYTCHEPSSLFVKPQNHKTAEP